MLTTHLSNTPTRSGDIPVLGATSVDPARYTPLKVVERFLLHTGQHRVGARPQQWHAATLLASKATR